MFMRVDRLQTELPKPTRADPNAASALQDLLGGKFGEMSTLNNYMFQSFNFRNKAKLKPFHSLVAGITAEELGHVELVTTGINMLASGPDPDRGEDVSTGPYADMSDKRNAMAFIANGGAAAVEPPRDIGRTRQLRLTAPEGAPYSLRYRVTQRDVRRYRCPLWLPTVAADGRSRRVRLAVAVPVRGRVHDLAAPGDTDLPAGEPPVVDVLREVLVDAGEAVGVEAEGVGLHADVLPDAADRPATRCRRRPAAARRGSARARRRARRPTAARCRPRAEAGSR